MHLMRVLCCLCTASQGQTTSEEECGVLCGGWFPQLNSVNLPLSRVDLLFSHKLLYASLLVMLLYRFCIRAQWKSDAVINFTADKSSVCVPHCLSSSGEEKTENKILSFSSVWCLVLTGLSKRS